MPTPVIITQIVPELLHPSLVRCPRCRRAADPVAEFGGEVLDNGPHAVRCLACGEPFVISTDVRYSFTSPAIETRRVYP